MAIARKKLSALKKIDTSTLAQARGLARAFRWNFHPSINNLETMVADIFNKSIGFDIAAWSED